MVVLGITQLGGETLNFLKAVLNFAIRSTGVGGLVWTFEVWKNRLNFGDKGALVL